MFNWLGNLFPYSDLHSLNLDWVLNKMKETAAQAAKAVADAANALAQVAEAKAAALSAQTAAQNAQTAAQNAQTAADNAADSAENAVAVAQAAKSAAQTAQNTAETAQSAAQTAQNTANTAQSAAQTAQNTANTAQTTAENAQTTAETALNKFPVTTPDIADNAVTYEKIADNAITTFKIEDGAITTTKIRNGTITNKQLTNNLFYVGIGSNTQAATKTPSEIAAGMATISFKWTATGTIIFCVYNSTTYKDGETTHYLYMYSDPFILITTSSKRVVQFTLSDYVKETGNITSYSGNLTLTCDSATDDVTGLFKFDENIPISDNVKIPYGITGLSARPVT